MAEDNINSLLSQIKGEINSLDKWSENFWKIEQEDDISPILASRGYEDKGYGHISGIINNVVDLLGKYLRIFSEKNNTDISEKVFAKYFESSLLMFYLSAHLHDIGMKFAEVFTELKPIVKGSERHSLHIMELIHDIHQYGSFIVLLGISKNVKIAEDPQDFHFFINIDTTLQDTLSNLTKTIEQIYKNHFLNFFANYKEFVVVLAIICLLHKEVKIEYVDNILKEIDQEQEILSFFQKWWGYFKLSTLWTNKTIKRKLAEPHTEDLFSGSGQIILKDQEGKLLNLFLVEALLQYGDKTEISINRLIRNPNNLMETPLEEFKKITKFDKDKDSIRSNIGRKAISDFARFRACRFIPVLDISVESSASKKNLENTRLDVIIKYKRYKGDNDIFPILRYHNEKDFYDLGFLQAICIHLPLLLKDLIKWENGIGEPFVEITFKKIEQSPDTIKDTKSSGRNDYNPYSHLNRSAIIKFSQSILNPELKKKKEGPKKVFYETSDLIVPSSFEVMAVFNLFFTEE